MHIERLSVEDGPSVLQERDLLHEEISIRDEKIMHLSRELDAFVKRFHAAENHIQALTRELAVANAALCDHSAQHASALAQFEELLAGYRTRTTTAENDSVVLRKRIATLELELARKDETASLSSAQRELQYSKRLRELELDVQELTSTKEELRSCRQVIARYEDDVKQITQDSMKLVVENDRLVRALEEQTPSHKIHAELKDKIIQKEAEVQKLQADLQESRSIITRIETSYEEELADARRELQVTSAQIAAFREQLSNLNISFASTHTSTPSPMPASPPPLPPPQLLPATSPIPPSNAAYDLIQAVNNTNTNTLNHTFSNFGLMDSLASTSTNNSALYATTPIPKPQLPLKKSATTSPTPQRSLPTPRQSTNPAFSVDTLVLEMKEKFALSNIIVPIEKVGDCLYKIGTRKLHLSVVKNRLVVRTSGGGYEDFFHFLAKMDTSLFRHLTKD